MSKLLVAMGAFALAACAQAAPHNYPAAAQTSFNSSCPAENEVCACTWDRLTRTLTYEEYQEALGRFRGEGLMDPRITHARGECIERHGS